ncbi:MAG: hypothetical protein V8S58_06625 [Lachnospiraceae bacterium]
MWTRPLVSGCSGGLFENIAAMADILKGYGIPGSGLNLGINPASLPVMADLMEQGIAGELAVSGERCARVPAVRASV